MQVHDQASQLTKLHADAQLLDSSLQESQRQAMALGTRLTLTENKNDELISQNQVCPPAVAQHTAATHENFILFAESPCTFLNWYLGDYLSTCAPMRAAAVNAAH
jgi:hypothetical protein